MKVTGQIKLKLKDSENDSYRAEKMTVTGQRK